MTKHIDITLTDSHLNVADYDRAVGVYRRLIIERLGSEERACAALEVFSAAVIGDDAKLANSCSWSEADRYATTIVFSDWQNAEGVSFECSVVSR